jgi:hypothetical protein
MKRVYFVSIALRARNVLRLGFDILLRYSYGGHAAALHWRLIRKQAQNRLFLTHK